MEIQVRSDSGGALEVSDAVFGAEYKPELIHQVVTAYLAAGRAGTRAQKNRAAVNGGGAKPFRQKGTGRARAGTSRGPLWRGGGRAFAAQPRGYAQKLNRKMYRGAFRSILSELARDGRLLVLPALTLEAAKTKELKKRLDDLGVSDALIILGGPEESVFRAARNLPNIAVATAEQADPVSLIAFEKVIATEDAIRKLEERLA